MTVVNNTKIGNFSGAETISDTVESIYSASLYTTTNLSLKKLANATGYAAALPDASSGQDVIEIISEDGFKGLQFNQEGDATGAFTRFMQNRGTDNFCPGNTFVCTNITNGSTYQILSWSDGNRIEVNGTVIVNSLNAGTGNQFTTAALSVGDFITGSKPFSFFRSVSLPALTGAYGGFCGYTFSTFHQRASGGTHKIFGYCLDPNPAQDDADATPTIKFATQIAAGGSATNPVLNGNTFPIETQEWTGTGYSTNFLEKDMVTSRCHYLTSTVLMCSWRGRLESSGNALKDATPLLPMTNETKYGWFSNSGMITAAAGTSQRIRNAIQSAAGDGNTVSIINRISNGATTEFSTNSLNGTNVNAQSQWVYVEYPIASTGTFFSGSPSVVYLESGVSSEYAGPIFSCESQGDGNGTQKTTFVTKKCMSKFTCNHGGGDWMAFLSTFQNSSAAASIIRKNNARSFVQSVVLGNTANGYTISNINANCTTARLTSISAGDIFKIVLPVGTPSIEARFAAWCDTNTATDDEMTLIMGDDMLFNSGTGDPQAMTFINTGAGGGGAASILAACSAGSSAFLLYTYGSNTLPASGDLIMTDSQGDFAFTSHTANGSGASTAGRFYKFQDGVARLNYAVSFESQSGIATGVVNERTQCSDRRLKKNIEKIGESPSGINIYKYEFKNTIYGEGEFVGVMAQEVPQASRDSEGVLHVNYDLLDVLAQEWNGDNCNCKKDYCYNCTH